jgi:hypothetical protein
MSTKPRSPAELLTAAQDAGWHHNELGRAILAELAVRQRAAARPRQIIWVLSIALALTAGCLVFSHSQAGRWEDKAADRDKEVARVEQAAKDHMAQADREAAAERARANSAVSQQEAMITSLRNENAAVVQNLTNQITALSKEVELLRTQNIELKFALEAAQAAKKP